MKKVGVVIPEFKVKDGKYMVIKLPKNDDYGAMDVCIRNLISMEYMHDIFFEKEEREYLLSTNIPLMWVNVDKRKWKDGYQIAISVFQGDTHGVRKDNCRYYGTFSLKDIEAQE